MFNAYTLGISAYILITSKSYAKLASITLQHCKETFPGLGY